MMSAERIEELHGRVPRNAIVKIRGPKFNPETGAIEQKVVGETLYYDLFANIHYTINRDQPVVLAASPARQWSLEAFSVLLDQGDVRPAPANIPPRAVTERLDAHTRWSTIIEVFVEEPLGKASCARVVWTGLDARGKRLVLDVNGHIVRSRALIAAADSAYAERHRTGEAR